VTVDLQLSPVASATAVITWDHAHTFNVPLTPPAESLTRRIIFGEDCATPPFGMLFDNVVCDVR
jgi:hypothetical protein